LTNSDEFIPVVDVLNADELADMGGVPSETGTAVENDIDIFAEASGNIDDAVPTGKVELTDIRGTADVDPACVDKTTDDRSVGPDAVPLGAVELITKGTLLAGAVPGAVTLDVGADGVLNELDVRGRFRPIRSSPELLNSGPVLSVPVGKAALELADSGGKVIDGCPVPTGPVVFSGILEIAVPGGNSVEFTTGSGGPVGIGAVPIRVI